ncbi:L,D-transpeptidase [Methylobacterium segetis]|uniref:L,D-transpeptidase n=1 Tax=Methylobacterium segetis TaxID=2488750 RepID=UPI001051019A|nr:L,D-transpeptidase [Methylobacterium segetis]
MTQALRGPGIGRGAAGGLGRLAAGLLLGLSLPLAAAAEVVIRIDKAGQRMSVSVNGQERHVWPVSTGASGYDTPSGTFRPSRMSRHHLSREWDNAPMPYAIFFTAEGHAIHGTNQSRHLGRPASHGCIRLSPGNASRLFALVGAEGLANTQVVVEGEDGLIASRGPGIDPLAALQQSAAARARWQTDGTSLGGGAGSARAPKASAPEGLAPAAAPAPTVEAAVGAAPAPSVPAPVPERDTVLGKLLDRGAKMARPICTAC